MCRIFALVARTEDVHISAAAEAAVLPSVPAELPAAARFKRSGQLCFSASS
jgi:hypothetical protein